MPNNNLFKTNLWQEVDLGFWPAFDQYWLGVGVGKSMLFPKVEPPKPKTMVQWVVVLTEGGCNSEEVFSTRAEARSVVKYDKKNDFKSHIERREYQLISSKKVS